MRPHWGAVLKQVVQQDVDSLEKELRQECQKRAIYLLGSSTKDIIMEGAEPHNVEHPRFHWPNNHVWRTANDYHERGVLPEAGGVLDQDYFLMMDVITLSAVQNYWLFEIRKKRELADGGR